MLDLVVRQKIDEECHIDGIWTLASETSKTPCASNPGIDSVITLAKILVKD
jgi:hypothetical protein